VVYRYVSIPMTLSDPNPGFKVTVHLQVDYLKNGASCGRYGRLTV